MSRTSLTVGKLTDIGQVRSRNEDSMDLRQADGDDGVSLFLVADGMGGHSAGNVASQMAIEKIMKQFFELHDGPLAERLRKSIEDANRAIYEAAQQNIEYFRMGTTIVGAVVAGNRADVANVGDSRAYLVRDGKIDQVTRDHSWVALQVEMGELTPEEAQTSQNRSVLLRCLGEKSDVLVDLLPLKLQPGDILVLCTDGLHGLLNADEIKDTVTSLDPQAACEHLVTTSNERGGHDNITVQVVRVDDCPPQDDSEPAAAATPAVAPGGAAASPTMTPPPAPPTPPAAPPPASWQMMGTTFLGGLIVLGLAIALLHHPAPAPAPTDSPAPGSPSGLATVLPVGTEQGVTLTRRVKPLRSLQATDKYLYWLEGEEPTEWMRLPLNATSPPVEPVAVREFPHAFSALATLNGRFFLATSDGIDPYDAAGQLQPHHHLGLTAAPRLLAANDQQLFWVAPEQSAIETCTLSDLKVSTLSKVARPVTALVMRPDDGQLYWAEEGKGIFSQKNGTPIANGSPSYLTADATWLYWTENSPDGDPDSQLRRCRYDGSELQTLANLRGAVVALANNASSLFWVVSDANSYSIKRAHKIGDAVIPRSNAE